MCERPAPAALVTTRDSAGVRIIEVSDPAALAVPEWTVSAEPSLAISGDESRVGHDLFGVRGAVMLGDGRVAIANGGTQEIRFFSRDGALAGTAGRKGQGPGEFNTIAVLPGREEFFAAVGDGAARSEVPFGRNAFVSVGPDLVALGANDAYAVSLYDARTSDRMDSRELHPASCQRRRRERVEGAPARAHARRAPAETQRALRTASRRADTQGVRWRTRRR